MDLVVKGVLGYAHIYKPQEQKGRFKTDDEIYCCGLNIEKMDTLNASLVEKGVKKVIDKYCQKNSAEAEREFKTKDVKKAIWNHFLEKKFVDGDKIDSKYTKGCYVLHARAKNKKPATAIGTKNYVVEDVKPGEAGKIRSGDFVALNLNVYIYKRPFVQVNLVCVALMDYGKARDGVPRDPDEMHTFMANELGLKQLPCEPETVETDEYN